MLAEDATGPGPISYEALRRVRLFSFDQPGRPTCIAPIFLTGEPNPTALRDRFLSLSTSGGRYDVDSNHIPHNNPALGIDRAPWDISDIYTPRELYHPNLIAIAVNTGNQLTKGRYHDTMDIPGVSDQYQSTAGYYNSTVPANPYQLNPAITPPINHRQHNPEAVTSRLGPSTHIPDSHHYNQQKLSITSISPIGAHGASPAAHPGSQPGNPGGTRRRPNVCDICGEEVRRPGLLEDHMNSHTGQQRE
ncbi:unnamed protein product [Rhizoctonia solani]|uniref:C2H2-type domain-containing protein n=1 Tax=Rhizoctonia solani TaxID=456999 RepID=A0A8H3HCW6_9AGAM|nr:unnamed protein product [Rhizoctonia solani]